MLQEYWIIFFFFFFIRWFLWFSQHLFGILILSHALLRDQQSLERVGRVQVKSSVSVKGTIAEWVICDSKQLLDLVDLITLP